MSSAVLPSADPLSSTRNCELAAILLSLGFEPVERNMTLASGSDHTTRGFWRFVQPHPRRAYLMHAVLHYGTRADLASVPSVCALPAYPEQAYMCAALHNRRMLVEHAMHATPMRLEPCGYLYLLQRTGSYSMPNHLSESAMAAFRACSVPSNDFAATLATLGFDPFAGGGQGIAHTPTGTTWHFPEVSPGSSLSFSEISNLYHSVEWVSRPDNTHPIACCAAVLANLALCRAALRSATEFVRAEANGRVAWLRRDAADATWQQAEQFLTLKA